SDRSEVLLDHAASSADSEDGDFRINICNSQFQIVRERFRTRAAQFDSPTSTIRCLCRRREGLKSRVWLLKTSGEFDVPYDSHHLRPVMIRPVGSDPLSHCAFAGPESPRGGLVYYYYPGMIDGVRRSERPAFEELSTKGLKILRSHRLAEYLGQPRGIGLGLSFHQKWPAAAKTVDGQCLRYRCVFNTRNCLQTLLELVDESGYLDIFFVTRSLCPDFGHQHAIHFPARIEVREPLKPAQEKSSTRQ